MNIYDFDGTIHRGDSSFAFYRYCLLHRPYIILLLPAQLFGVVLYLLKRIDLTKMKEFLYLYYRWIDAEKMAKQFWDQDIPKNIYTWFEEYPCDNKVLVSASPEFFLQTACEKLGIGTLIASKIDPKTGKALGPNCSGQEKKRQFLEQFPDAEPENSFFDKSKDLYVSNLAKHRYKIVRGIPHEQN
ncbi:MAG: haloacid dehalogenase-like hydrolase [Oscillospiraceae bacterium]|nr:haloacid dehalogenase-like hydrolase [Oscillospiraceae bacterium]